MGNNLEHIYFCGDNCALVSHGILLQWHISGFLMNFFLLLGAHHLIDTSSIDLCLFMDAFQISKYFISFQ
jgi:hypothetical protein